VQQLNEQIVEDIEMTYSILILVKSFFKTKKTEVVGLEPTTKKYFIFFINFE
jgi:hypothetical protein